MLEKKDYLNPEKLVEHIDIKKYNVVPLVDAMGKMAFQARTLSRAANIYSNMLADKECSIYLTIAGSLFSAGLKHVVVDMIRNNMVDAIISNGANIVDQDFFEALGYRHYQGTQFVDDNALRELMIDRIYDTYIDEDELRVCDMTVAEIANSLEARPYSSREFIEEMGKYLVEHDLGKDSVIRNAYEKRVPIFCPAFSDCSAGFGLVHHQYKKNSKNCVSIDSAKDFLELTKTKIHNPVSGVFMLGGGVPKNFTQDIVVACEVLGKDARVGKKTPHAAVRGFGKPVERKESAEEVGGIVVHRSAEKLLEDDFHHQPHQKRRKHAPTHAEDRAFVLLLEVSLYKFLEQELVSL